MQESWYKISRVLYGALATMYAGLLAHKYTRREMYCSDTSEIIDGMISYGGLALSLGVLYWMWSYSKGYFKSHNYVLHILLRYALAYFLISYGLSQILDTRYPPSLTNLDLKIAEMNSGQVVWSFFSYTYVYQAFIGWTQLIACCLLFFRFTAPLGLILLTAIMANATMINYSYGLCPIGDSVLYLSLILFLLLPYARNLMNVLVLNKGAVTIQFPFFTKKGHGYKALSILKFVIIAGILTYYYNPHRRYLRYYYSNTNNPIYGVWNIEDIKYDTVPLDSSQANVFNSFQSLFLEKRRYGAVKSGDTLSAFEYMIDTTYHQLEFWNFHEFRSLDLKGKYLLSHPDTLIYRGINNKDSIEIKMSLDKRYQAR
ncbi:MAG: hypothetical protein HKN68_07555 [Saprospiraceae bacterium]|nr:hypothetical protein [Saprospiraceae bacterium]